MPESILNLDLFHVADRLDESISRAANSDDWYTGVEIHLLAYRSLLQLHTDECSEDELYHDAIAAAPRVTSIVDRLRVECTELDQLAAHTLAALHAPNRTTGDVSARLRELLMLTNRHRSRAIALMHEAYAVDIGGPG